MEYFLNSFYFAGQIYLGVSTKCYVIGIVADSLCSSSLTLPPTMQSRNMPSEESFDQVFLNKVLILLDSEVHFH